MIIFDTNALITFFSTDKENAEYKNLVAYIRRSKDKVLALPLPAVAEFLVKDNNPSRSAYLFNPKSKLKLLQFDIKSTLKAADLAKKYNNHLIKKTLEGTRQKVKVDIQILAIGIANNAEVIITRDRDIKKLVEALELKIQVFDYFDDNILTLLENTKIYLEAKKMQ